MPARISPWNFINVHFITQPLMNLSSLTQAPQSCLSYQELLKIKVLNWQSWGAGLGQWPPPDSSRKSSLKHTKELDHTLQENKIYRPISIMSMDAEVRNEYHQLKTGNVEKNITLYINCVIVPGMQVWFYMWKSNNRIHHFNRLTRETKGTH